MSQQPPSLDDATLRQMIEATIAASGDHDPAALPHLIRRRLEGQVSGQLGLDELIQQVLRERQSKPPRP